MQLSVPHLAIIDSFALRPSVFEIQDCRNSLHPYVRGKAPTKNEVDCFLRYLLNRHTQRHTHTQAHISIAINPAQQSWRGLTTTCIYLFLIYHLSTDIAICFNCLGTAVTTDPELRFQETLLYTYMSPFSEIPKSDY